MNQLIVSTAFVIIPSIWVARVHAIKKLKDETIHMYEKDGKAILAVAYSIIWAFLVQGALKDPDMHVDKIDWWMTLVFTIYFQTIHWITFDLSMNLFSKEKWNYISDNGRDDNDALTDTLFHWIPEKYSGWSQILVKVILLIFTVSSIIREIQ